MPAEPQLFLLDKSFYLSGWDLSHLTSVIESNCLATHGFFFVIHVLKGNVHQKKARAGRRKLSYQVTLLDIKATCELKLSGTSGGLCIYLHRFLG